jgi:hypothetical protein
MKLWSNKMEILQKDISGKSKSYISLGGTDILLEKSTTDYVYSGSISPNQTIPFSILLSTFLIPKTTAPSQLVVSGLKLDLDQTGELISFESQLDTHEHTFTFDELLKILGMSIEIQQFPMLHIGLMELHFNRPEQHFFVKGSLTANENRSELELDVQLLSEGGVDISFSCNSEEKSCITVGNLIESTLPESLTSLLQATGDGSTQNRMLQNLTGSGLTDLQMNLNTADEELSFFAKGTVLGFKGEIAFSIMKFIDQRMVSFHIYGDEETNLKSIPGVLKDILGLDIPKNIESFMPKMEFAFTELTFDQLEESFRLRGVMAQAGVSEGKAGYRLEGCLEVQWQDGIRLDIELDASKSPLTLAALEKDIPFSLGEIKQVIPENVVKKIGATEFHSLGINIDTAEGSICLEGAANLFGSLAIGGSFYFSQQDGLTFNTKVYSDPLSLGEIIGFFGVDIDKTRLPTLRIGLKELNFDQEDRQFLIKGLVIAGEGRAELELEVHLLPEGGVEISFNYRSGEDARLTVGDLIESTLPESFKIILPAKKDASENALVRNLKDSGLTHLQFNLNTAEEEMNFFAKGIVLGMKGEIGFSIMKFIDRRMVSFHLYGDEKTNLKSIPDILQDTLGLNISQDIQTYLPKMEFALTELTFDQMEELFRLKGVMAQGGVSKGKEGYRLESTLEVEWQDGIRVYLDLDADESPLTLAALENDLPFSLDVVKQVIPGQIIKKIGATAFHKFGVSIDTSVKRLDIDGVANLFGSLAVSISVSFFEENNRNCLILNASVYADPLSIRELPGLIGIDDICDKNIIKVLPDLRMGLKQIVLDQQQELFSISGMVGIGESSADTNFGIQKHPENSGVIIEIGFEGNADHPPSLIELLGAVIPDIDAADIHLPGNFDITMQTMNLSLDTGNKSLKGEAEGALIISNVPIYLSAKSKTQDDPWIFAGNSEPGKQISLTGLTSEILQTIDSNIEIPKGIPEIYFQYLVFSINTKTKELSFKCGANVASTVKFRNKDCALSLGIDVNYNPEKEDEKLTLKLDGSLSIGSVDFLAELNLSDLALSLKMDEGDTLNFKEVAEFFLGEELFNTLPQGLADNLAGVAINRFDSYIDFENKGIFLDISTGLKNIRLGADDLLVKKVDIALKLDVSDNRKYCLIDISGKGSIGSAIIFESCEFKFEYDEKDGKPDWTLAGRFDAQIFGHDMILEAGYKDIDNVKTMVLHAKDPFPAIEFPGVASFELDDFMLKVEKKEEEKAAWGLSATFQFKTETDIFDLRNGTAALINEAGKTGLMLSAAGIDMKIPGLSHLPWFTLDKPQLELVSVKRKADRVWSVHGKTGFIVHNVPDILSRVFPIENVVSECTINDKKAEFGIRLEDGLIKLPVPPGIGDFGNAYIGINEMKVNLMDGGSLTVKIKFGLPKGLNDIFRTGPDETEEGKKEKLEIFRVYDPDGEKELIGLNMIISSKRGLVCELDQTPFKFFEITEDAAGKKIFDIDMKEFGRVTIDVPTLSLTPEGSFSASGGFDIKKDLSIPLTPLKYLLDQAGLSDISKNLNDGIPLKGINFYSQREGETRKHFHTDAFFELFTSEPGQVPIPGWLREGFKMVDDILDRLPDDFLEYGNIEIPKHLHFNIDVSAEGSFKFQVSVKDPENEDESIPLKMLVPNFPSFIGIELYSLAFGVLFGGALLRLDVDVKIDVFDLPPMLAALLLPYDSLPKEIASKLPDPKTFQNSSRIKNLLVAIVYQAAGIPIPIPLFYDELSFSYKGPDGFEIKSGFGFPKPKLELANIGILITEFIGFFKDGKDIDRKKVEKISLGDFIIGPNYLRLPKYISTEEDDPGVGTLLGTEEGFTIKPVLLFCALLNAVKNGSINELIQVVEVRRRVGEFDMKVFDLLEIHLEYAFTTPYEFIDYAYKELSSFNRDQAREYIKILPPKKTGLRATEDGEDTYAPITENTEGFVIFMKGNLDIAHALIFDTGFGLVASGEGFAMGAQFDGRLDNIFNIHMKGVMGIKKDGKFLLEGDSHLSILEQDLLQGYFCFHNEGLLIKGKAGAGPVRMEGELAGTFTNDLFHLKGSAALVIFNLSAHGGAEILISDAKKMVVLHGDFSIGAFLKLRVTLESLADSSRAGMNLNMEGRLSNLLELSLTGSAYAAGRLLQAEGSASMKILNQEVISAGVQYKKDVILFHGHLDLFPGNKLLEVNGDAAGMLSDDKFELSGGCRMKIVSCPFAEARVLVTDKKMMFTARLFDVTALLLAGKNDSGLMLYGGMSPIIMDKLLSITCTDQAYGMGAANLGGPGLLVSTRSPYFMLQGMVRILGIESSTNIIFDNNGFRFNISGNIFNLIKGELTVAGDNFDDSENIYIEGKIEIGDIAGAVTKQIAKVAGDINNQLRLLDNKLADAHAYLKQQQDAVNGLNSQIRYCKNSIANLKRQIEAKKRWYNSLPWYMKAYQWIELGTYIAVKGVEIASLYARIGVLEGLKLAAIGLLEVAKASVNLGRKMIKEAIGLNNAIAQWSREVLSFGPGLFSIQSAHFSSSLNSACGGSVLINVNLTFMNKSYSLKNMRFNLLNPDVGVNSIINALKK